MLFVLLSFGVSFGIPAENAPETEYDESETLPYESAVPFSVLTPLGGCRDSSSAAEVLAPKLRNASLFTLAGFRDTTRPPCCKARVDLALFCTLLI